MDIYSKISILVGLILALIFGLIYFTQYEKITQQKAIVSFYARGDIRAPTHKLGVFIGDEITIKKIDDHNLIVHVKNQNESKKYPISDQRGLAFIIKQYTKMEKK